MYLGFERTPEYSDICLMVDISEEFRTNGGPEKVAISLHEKGSVVHGNIWTRVENKWQKIASERIFRGQANNSHLVAELRRYESILKEKYRDDLALDSAKVQLYSMISS